MSVLDRWNVSSVTFDGVPLTRFLSAVDLDLSIRPARSGAVPVIPHCEGPQCTTQPAWWAIGPCGCAVSLCNLCRCLFESWLRWHSTIRCTAGHTGQAADDFQWAAIR